jgi:hypothetical protein
MPVIYDCLTCEGKPHFENHVGLLKHINETHGHVMGKTKYTSRLKMCLDGAAGWHQQVHELDFGDYQILQTWTSK